MNYNWHKVLSSNQRKFEEERRIHKDKGFCNPHYNDYTNTTIKAHSFYRASNTNVFSGLERVVMSAR